jgi:geranylgeranyl pyrophosphate synthase
MHTASLMHDDVIDQAATRRGKDAVHIKWGNKIAILTGDYLLSQVFRIFVASKSWELMEIAVEIVENITTGEVEQAFAGQDSGELEAQYFRWIGKKSASFFAGCCKAGSLMSGGNKEQQKIWFDYGYNLGIAFQLIDDLLDYTGEGSLTGKPLYGDLVNRVLTLPLIRTLEQTSGNGQLNSYLKGNNNSSYNLEDLEAIADIILAGDGPEYTYRKAEEYAKRSIDLVASLEIDGSEHKTMVEEVPRSLLRRNK